MSKMATHHHNASQQPSDMTSYSVTEAANHEACCHIWSRLTRRFRERGLTVFIDIQESVTHRICVLSKFSQNNSRINYLSWHYLFIRPWKLSVILMFRPPLIPNTYLFFSCFRGVAVLPYLQCHMAELTTNLILSSSVTRFYLTCFFSNKGKKCQQNVTYS